MSKEAQETAARLRKARAKKENSLIIKIQESDLYDWDTTARLTLLVIAFGQRTNEDAWVPDDMPDEYKNDLLGWCDMSQWRIALRVGKSEVQIQRVLDRMYENGVIDKRTWRDDNNTDHCMYRVMDKVVSEHQRPEQSRTVVRGKRYKTERKANKGSFSTTNQPGRTANQRAIMEEDGE